LSKLKWFGIGVGSVVGVLFLVAIIISAYNSFNQQEIDSSRSTQEDARTDATQSWISKNKSEIVIENILPLFPQGTSQWVISKEVTNVTWNLLVEDKPSGYVEGLYQEYRKINDDEHENSIRISVYKFGSHTSALDYLQDKHLGDTDRGYTDLDVGNIESTCLGGTRSTSLPVQYFVTLDCVKSNIYYRVYGTSTNDNGNIDIINQAKGFVRMISAEIAD
jgi:hypothetical protein